jgi:phosphatidylethanolamine/phosphatidyl-N-methylethanolamine N-methyltransferase
VKSQVTQAQHLETMDAQDVRNAYRRWAPVYDATFGKIVRGGVKQAVARANLHSGRLLDVGVGTGLALPLYDQQLRVTGIDLSSDMLKRARKRADDAGCENIEALEEMDAGHLAFADNSFDVVVAMYVLTVVPDPQRVMAEMARVAKPDGVVIVVNHFSVEGGVRGSIEKAAAKHATKLGWRPEFPVDTVLCSERLRLVSIKPVKPFDFFTMLEFRKIC